MQINGHTKTRHITSTHIFSECCREKEKLFSRRTNEGMKIS